MSKKIAIIEDLISTISQINNATSFFGFSQKNKKCKTLRYYNKFLFSLEKTLLKNWHYLKDHKEDEGIRWQIFYFEKELNKKKSLFHYWNRFLIAYNNERADIHLANHPWCWSKYLFYKVSDKNYIASIVPNFQENSHALTLVITLFQQWQQTDPDRLIKALISIVPQQLKINESIDFFDYKQAKPAKKPSTFLDQHHQKLITLNKSALAKWIINYWQKSSGGFLSINQIFTFSPKETIPLKPINNKKQIAFKDLYGLEKQKTTLINNTDLFLQNKKAQNILLWGARGSGKSSSIQALAHHYKGKSLKIIEMNKRYLNSLESVCSFIEQYNEKFIIFIDDISFLSHEESYKEYKSLMDGSLKTINKNYIFYVTSNVKSLVKLETKHDIIDPEVRQKNDELKAIDDRFGLKLRYENRQFADLDTMLFALAKSKKIHFDETQLKNEFRRFCLFNEHDQPSGRSIKQFLETLEQKKRS